MTGKTEEIAANENSPQLVDDYREDNFTITTEPQRVESQQRQQKIAEQFAANREDTSQPRMKPDDKRHQEILKSFVQSREELVESDELTEEAVQRQQTTAQQFFENEELTTPPLADDKTRLND